MLERIEMGEFFKFIKENFKMSTVMVIIVLGLVNFAFWKWHNIININEIISRIVIHLMITSNIIMFEFIRRWYKTKPWMVPLLGAWWNRYEINNPEPFCAGCKQPLMPTTNGSNIFKCTNGHEICFRDENGNLANLDTIKLLVKDKLKKGIKTGKVK